MEDTVQDNIDRLLFELNIATNMREARVLGIDTTLLVKIGQRWIDLKEWAIDGIIDPRDYENCWKHFQNIVIGKYSNKEKDAGLDKIKVEDIKLLGLISP